MSGPRPGVILRTSLLLAAAAALAVALPLVPRWLDIAQEARARAVEESAIRMATAVEQVALNRAYLRWLQQADHGRKYTFVFDASSLVLCEFRLGDDGPSHPDCPRPDILVLRDQPDDWLVDRADPERPPLLQRHLLTAARERFHQADPGVEGVRFVDDGEQAFANASGRSLCPPADLELSGRLRLSRAVIATDRGIALMFAGSAGCEREPPEPTMVMLRQRDGDWCVAAQWFRGLRRDGDSFGAPGCGSGTGGAG